MYYKTRDIHTVCTGHVQFHRAQILSQNSPATRSLHLAHHHRISGTERPARPPISVSVFFHFPPPFSSFTHSPRSQLGWRTAPPSYDNSIPGVDTAERAAPGTSPSLVRDFSTTSSRLWSERFELRALASSFPAFETVVPPIAAPPITAIRTITTTQLSASALLLSGKSARVAIDALVRALESSSTENRTLETTSLLPSQPVTSSPSAEPFATLLPTSRPLHRSAIPTIRHCTSTFSFENPLSVDKTSNTRNAFKTDSRLIQPTFV